MPGFIGSVPCAGLAASLFAAAAAPAADTKATAADQQRPGSATDPEKDTTAPTDPYLEQAPLDVRTVMTDGSKAYLQARARLEAHPALAAEALHDRLAAIPAPGPAVRKRLFDVLATVARPEDLPLFADELRRAVKGAGSRAKAVDSYGAWRHLLVDQGGAAAPLLRDLVADQALPDDVRDGLLADLVQVTPADKLGELVVLVGRGRADLGRTLRRSLTDRARNDEAARAHLTAAADRALDGALATGPDAAELERLPALLRFRAGLGGETAALATRLATVAGSAEASFAARAASVRGLGVLGSEETTAALQTIARQQLSTPVRQTQAGEVLGWLALQGLAPADAAALGADLRLIEDDAPRLASMGYTVAQLPGDKAAWLKTALGNPWPQVRQAALDRVEGPCPDPVVVKLAKRGGASDTGGDSDRAVARAAVAALGRCGGGLAMRRLGRILDNTRVDMELRAEAARRLARHGGAAGANAVARQLAATSDRALARRFASALRKTAVATPKVDEALCDEMQTPGEVARAAADTLRTLHEPGDDPCGGDAE